jgi:hypothetical protein
MTKKLNAEHGAICSRPGERFSYFGWPTIARMADGTLLAVCSGPRAEHICPWGKMSLYVSRDDGRSWSSGRVIQDGVIDDRDAGVVPLGGNRLLVSWFTSDTRRVINATWWPEEKKKGWAEVLATWTDDQVAAELGSWVKLSDDAGETWGAPIRVPVSAPHGPIRLACGALLYLGKGSADMRGAGVLAARSADGGRTWEVIGRAPLCASDLDASHYHEPHVVELPDGRLLGAIRYQKLPWTKDRGTDFFMCLTRSEDGGRTWVTDEPLGFHGSPPHLLRHSSGAIVLTYGRRRPPFGERVAVSDDDGRTWNADWVLREALDDDLGYPATVELGDGSLLSVYYQKLAPGQQPSLLWSRWALPLEI